MGFKFVVLGLFKLKNSQPFFALVKNKLGITSIVYLPHKIFLGFIIRFFLKKTLFAGARVNGFFLPLYLIKTGDVISNIFLNQWVQKPWAKSAGGCCKVLYKTFCNNFLVITLPSGLKKRISVKFFCILGKLSNIYHKKEIIGSAGLNSCLGYRPSVRGIAMNPVDHPHGGRTNTVKPEVSPWGWVTKFKH